MAEQEVGMVVEAEAEAEAVPMASVLVLALGMWAEALAAKVEAKNAPEDSV